MYTFSVIRDNWIIYISFFSLYGMFILQFHISHMIFFTLELFLCVFLEKTTCLARRRENYENFECTFDGLKKKFLFWKQFTFCSTDYNKKKPAKLRQTENRNKLQYTIYNLVNTQRETFVYYNTFSSKTKSILFVSIYGLNCISYNLNLTLVCWIF